MPASRMFLFIRFLPAFLFFLTGLSQPLVNAQQNGSLSASLTQAIDSNFKARSHLFADIPVADDAIFARRVALDLTGMPLSLDRLKSFIGDKSADKRTKLVDELLARPESARHLATWLSMILLERRSAKVANDDLWMAYLIDVIRNDKPLTDLTTDLLTATGEEGPKQVAARFLMDREAEPNLLTRDVGRVFLGRDMQCNQCHDHPLVDGYLQNDYQSLLAFLQPTSVATVKQAGKDKTLLTEKNGGRVLFDSVFIKDDSLLTGPALFGLPPVFDPEVKPGNEYLQRQSPSTIAKPVASRRAALASQIVRSPYFAQNWSNRIWSIAFGRGVIHPPDFTHPENPPVDAELLKSLSEAFAAAGYRIKPVLRAIVLSRPYQSPFDLTGPMAQPTKPGDMAEMKSTLDRFTADLEKLEESFKKTRAEWNRSMAAAVPAQKARDALGAKLDEFGGKRDLAAARIAEIVGRLEQIGPQRSALTEAKNASAKVVAAIAGDKDLETAAKMLADKLAKLEAEQTALIDESAKKAVERRTAEEQLASVQFQARSADNTLAPLMAEVNRTESPFRMARKALDEKIQSITSLKNEIYWRETCNAYLKAESEIKDIAFQLAQIEPMLESQRNRRDSALKIQKELASALDKIRADFKETESRQVMIQQQVQQTQLAIQSVEKSHEELRTAARLIPELNELGQIQSMIDKSRATLIQKNQLAQSSAVKIAEKAASIRQKQSDQETESAAAQKALATAESEFKMISDQHAALVLKRKDLDSSLDSVSETITRLGAERFELAGLKPLSPESLAWSIMKATGVYDNYWKTEQTALDKAKPVTDAQKSDSAFMAAREAEIEQAVYNKLKSYPTQFARLYGLGEGQPQADFFASADQALYFANGGSVASWCMPSAGNPADAMLKATTPAAAADALYIGVLGRQADTNEIRLVSEALAKADAKTRASIAADLVWGLLASPEFRFNH